MGESLYESFNFSVYFRGSRWSFSRGGSMSEWCSVCVWCDKKSLHHNIRKNFPAVLTVHRAGIPDWVDLSLFPDLLKQRSLDLLLGLLQRESGMRVRAGLNDLWVLPVLRSSDFTFFTCGQVFISKYYPSCASYILRFIIDLKKSRKTWWTFCLPCSCFPISSLSPKLGWLGRIVRGENRN